MTLVVEIDSRGSQRPTACDEETKRSRHGCAHSVVQRLLRVPPDLGGFPVPTARLAGIGDIQAFLKRRHSSATDSVNGDGMKDFGRNAKLHKLARRQRTMQQLDRKAKLEIADVQRLDSRRGQRFLRRELSAEVVEQACDPGRVAIGPPPRRERRSHLCDPTRVLKELLRETRRRERLRFCDSDHEGR